MKPVLRRHLTSEANGKIELKIDRIVLDGMQLNRAELQQLGQSLEQELSRLLQASNPLALQSGAQARLQAAAIDYGLPFQAADLGRQIAQSLHASLQFSNHTSQVNHAAEVLEK